MATLDEVPDSQDPVHLLAIGDTKSGKSTYAAEAAIAGFTLIYLDSDNGKSALKYALRNHPEAMKRVHYFNTSRPADFLQALLRSSTAKPMWWNPETDQEVSQFQKPGEKDSSIWEFNITKVPDSWVLVVDTWTSVAADALGIGSAEQSAKLIDGTDQQIYGAANAKLTYVCNMIQKLPCHAIVQAHGTKYEVYEKPTGKSTSSMKQGEMILRETIDVPVSSSRPHGQVMATRFNHIGWLGVDHTGQTTIDFRRRPNRVGGGPPNQITTTDKLPFAKLVGTPPPQVDPSTYEGWHRIRRSSEVTKTITLGSGAKPNVAAPAAGADK